MKVVVVSPKSSFRSDLLLSKLEELGAVFYEKSGIDLGEIPELFANEDVVLAIDELQVKGGFETLNSYLPKFKNVKYICGLSSRYHEVDIDEAVARGIVCSNNPGVTTESVAELAFTLMLAITRNLPLHTRSDFDFYGINSLGREYKSLTVGVVGYGNIGGRIAQICDTNGMKVSFWSRNKKHTKYQQEDISTVFRNDVVVIALPTTAETKMLIDKSLLDTLLPHQYVVDITASDELYDKNIIIDMVNRGKIAGFGFEAETAGSTYINSMGNVLITPHVGWGTKESYHNMYRGWVDSITNASKNMPINIAK